MSRPNAFGALMRRQGTTEQREYLNRVRTELRLAEDDALWALVLVVQEFCATLRAEPQMAKAPSVPPDAGSSSWPWVALGASLQTIIVGLAMYVGALAASQSAPPWLNVHAPAAHGVSRMIAGALGAPAGWLAFVFAAPMALQGVAVGRSLLRAGDRILGQSVIALSVTAAAGCAAALWWVL